MFSHKLKVVLLINDMETYVETCVCLKLSKLLNKEHVEVFTKTVSQLPDSYANVPSASLCHKDPPVPEM